EEKQLDAEKKKSDLDKAKLQASVPRDLLSGRQFEENQTALLRTKTEYDKSLDVVRSKRTQVASDRQNILLRIEKARREIARAASCSASRSAARCSCRAPQSISPAANRSSTSPTERRRA